MNFNKILGYLILFIGLATIIFTLYYSYNIFTARSNPPEVFKSSEKTISPKVNPQGLEVQIQEVLQEQLKGLMPTDTLPKLLNLISWSIAAGILIFGGSSVSSLGIKLLNKN